MARDWEQQFSEWAKPPGQTEQDRSDNAVNAITNAIKASPKLKNRNVSVFTQGSYRNNTNVKKDSDVDIGILSKATFYYQEPLPDGISVESLGNGPAEYNYPQYKNEVVEALVNYFGSSAVTRGNIAIDVRETSYHVEADVAPFFEHRRYRSNTTFNSGVELRTDNNRPIINWPDQHYDNGVDKNNQTRRRFKSVVRILKALSNEMVDENVLNGNLPGFLIECLVWNVPNKNFQSNLNTYIVGEALRFLYHNTLTDDLCEDWAEVSGLKDLFGTHQKWTRLQANNFTYAAWNHVGIWK